MSAEPWQIWFMENDSGVHALAGEYSVCGVAQDELDGNEVFGAPAVTCPDCVVIIRNLRLVRTCRPTKDALDGAKATAHEHNFEIGLHCSVCGEAQF